MTKKRTERIMIWFTATESQAIRRASEILGETVREFVRKSIASSVEGADESQDISRPALARIHLV